MSPEIFWSKPWNCYRMNKMTIYQKVSLDFKSKKRWINWKISWKLLVVKIFENSKKWWDFFLKIFITYLPAYLFKNKPKYICSPTQFILSINLSFLKSVEAFAYNIEIQSGGLCANYWKAFYALFQSFLIKNWCI